MRIHKDKNEAGNDMKVALYGEHKRELERERCQIETACEAHGLMAVVNSYLDEALLKDHLSEYDVVCMNGKLVQLLKEREQVAFTSGGNIETCYVDEIYYAEAELKDVHIWFAKEKKTVHLKFSEAEALLVPKGFIKVHRSFLVNCRYIKSIDNSSVSLENGIVLPVSKYRKKEVRSAYMEYMDKWGCSPKDRRGNEQ